jgi:hypothetical protein
MADIIGSPVPISPDHCEGRAGRLAQSSRLRKAPDIRVRGLGALGRLALH